MTTRPQTTECACCHAPGATLAPEQEWLIATRGDKSVIIPEYRCAVCGEATIIEMDLRVIAEAIGLRPEDLGVPLPLPN